MTEGPGGAFLNGSVGTAFADVLASITRLVHGQERRIAELSQQVAGLTLGREEARASAARAEEIMRQLVEIVDPSLWSNDQANMHQLVDRVRALKDRDG